MQYYGNAVHLGKSVYVLGTGYCSGYGCLLSVVRKRLTCYESCSTVGELYYHRRVDLACGLHYGVDSVGTRAVNGGYGETFFFGKVEYFTNRCPGSYSRFDFLAHCLIGFIDLILK